ncbi:MAG: deoxyhypusine synthase [Candidatus Omnitrophica bacterium]|nr:deoxyhypusine synthase [Candidatus Omnitrophota bacterium]
MKNKFLRAPVAPLSIRKKSSIESLLGEMEKTAFQGRKLGEAFSLWKRMLKERTTVFLGLAGALIPAGMRKAIVFLIRERLIDCLVTTGANLFHDLHEILGKHHYQGTPLIDDVELRRKKVDRIYDVFASDIQYTYDDKFITEFANSLDQKRSYSTREFFYLLGKRLSSVGKREGILTAAYKSKVPIYSPALADSSFGIAVALGRRKKENSLSFDIIKDVLETTDIAVAAFSTGVIYLGGGTPKNFIQQTEVTATMMRRKHPGHKYAIQITTDSPQWGGLSGCSLEEGQSWGKISKEAKMVTLHCDATIALPLLVTALAKGNYQNRKKPIFIMGEELRVR